MSFYISKEGDGEGDVEFFEFALKSILDVKLVRDFYDLRLYV